MTHLLFLNVPNLSQYNLSKYSISSYKNHTSINKHFMVALSPISNISHDAFRKWFGFLSVVVLGPPTMTLRNPKSNFVTALSHLYKTVCEMTKLTKTNTKQGMFIILSRYDCRLGGAGISKILFETMPCLFSLTNMFNLITHVKHCHWIIMLLHWN